MSESAEVKCDPFLQILEPMVRKLLADKDSWEAEDWDEDAFQVFFSEIALWLKIEKKKTSRVVAKTIAGLISYGVTTEEKLQLVGRGEYKVFTEKLSAEDVPKVICDLLFEKYVIHSIKRARSGDSAGVSASKRQKVLVRSNPVGAGILFSRLHETIVSDDTYTFAAEVLDSSNTVLWVRDCYSQMYEEIWRKAKKLKYIRGGKVTYHPVVIAGTSGIGKSFFGIYALFRAVREMDITVVYTMYGQGDGKKRYVIAPPITKMASFPRGDPRRLLLDLCNENQDIDFEATKGEGETENMWWGEWNQNSSDASIFINRLLGGESTWAFVDVQEGRVAEDTKRAIILVSDDPESYSSYINHKDGGVLFMSIWSEAEILKYLEKTKVAVDIVEVQQRYQIIGGVPRSIFSSNWGNRVAEVRAAINNLEPDSLGKTLVPGSNPRVTSRLVHLVSKPPFFNYPSEDPVVTSVYASEHIRTEIYNRFLFEEKFKLRTWLEYTKGLVGGGERGPRFEWFAHVVLGKLKEKLPVKITALSSSEFHTESKLLSPFATDTLLYNALNDISRLEAGRYVQPLKENEPAIDAFCISTGIPWEAHTRSEPVLLLFQITVARKHSILGEPLKKIIQHVKRTPGNDFDPEKHEIYLVFIVDELLSKPEPYLTKNKQKPLETRNLGDLKKIKQVCLQIV